MARPTGYRKKYNDIAYGLALMGLPENRIAEVLGISYRTLGNWKKKYPEFVQSIMNGKEQADIEVVSALRKRATGFTKVVKEQKVIDGKRVTLTTEKYYPPDTLAAKHWLNNRQPTYWQDKKVVETQDKPTMKKDLTELLNDLEEQRREFLESRTTH